MEPKELEQYLHEHIPMSAAMQVSVREVQPDRVVLSAPLKPNINHRDTVFGGSASALATLAAWSLVHVCLQTAGMSARLVIQHNSVDYQRPLTDEFVATAAFKNPELWSRFLKSLVRRGRARIGMTASLEQGGQVAGHFEGTFVALDAKRI